ncbi:uncharacterized protein [Epargyreus clarus]|uniref:uncharacterized protein isoform X2 n=1 Tax=Epargyreus clarus TaxID=520877 RepID=UPI003C2B4009
MDNGDQPSGSKRRKNKKRGGKKRSKGKSNAVHKKTQATSEAQVRQEQENQNQRHQAQEEATAGPATNDGKTEIIYCNCFERFTIRTAEPRNAFRQFKCDGHCHNEQQNAALIPEVSAHAISPTYFKDARRNQLYLHSAQNADDDVPGRPIRHNVSAAWRPCRFERFESCNHGILDFSQPGLAFPIPPPPPSSEPERKTNAKRGRRAAKKKAALNKLKPAAQPAEQPAASRAAAPPPSPPKASKNATEVQWFLTHTKAPGQTTEPELIPLTPPPRFDNPAPTGRGKGVGKQSKPATVQPTPAVPSAPPPPPEFDDLHCSGSSGNATVEHCGCFVCSAACSFCARIEEGRQDEAAAYPIRPYKKWTPRCRFCAPIEEGDSDSEAEYPIGAYRSVSKLSIHTAKHIGSTKYSYEYKPTQ